jgi:hypothetical protein
MIEQPHHHTNKAASDKQHAGFNPYQNNEGTVLGKLEIFITTFDLTKYCISHCRKRLLYGCC